MSQYANFGSFIFKSSNSQIFKLLMRAPMLSERKYKIKANETAQFKTC